MRTTPRSKYPDRQSVRGWGPVGKGMVIPGRSASEESGGGNQGDRRKEQLQSEKSPRERGRWGREAVVTCGQGCHVPPHKWGTYGGPRLAAMGTQRGREAGVASQRRGSMTQRGSRTDLLPKPM